MILDASAVVGVLRHEADARQLAQAVEDADSVSISSATALEASLVLGPERGDELSIFLSRVTTIVPFDAEQLAVARAAHARYGRGSGSKARLNFGDCFSYALAKSTGEPLLFKGDDFTHTDITPAL